jgi:coiled-coil domain-containing protein 61
MLASALARKSNSVFVDLLTYSDLEMLKNRKAGAGANTSQQSNSSNQRAFNKRYLILTYTVEFDRVHYPLPLTFQVPRRLPTPTVCSALTPRR